MNREYMMCQARDPKPKSMKVTLHLFTIAKDGRILAPLCRWGYNRQSGMSWSIWRIANYKEKDTLISKYRVCRNCEKRASKNLGSVRRKKFKNPTLNQRNI